MSISMWSPRRSAIERSLSFWIGFQLAVTGRSMGIMAPVSVRKICCHLWGDVSLPFMPRAYIGRFSISKRALASVNMVRGLRTEESRTLPARVSSPCQVEATVEMLETLADIGVKQLIEK